MEKLEGSFRVLVLYDLAEQIHLDRLREILGVETPSRAPSFKHPAPDYVRFEHPPVVEYPGSISLASGEQFDTRIKYFDYGVACVELEMRFDTDWDGLVLSSSRWTSTPELETRTSELLRTRLERVRPALVQPYASWLSEDYYVIHLTKALDEVAAPLTAESLLSTRGSQIAKIVRGESMPLADSECREALQSCISYYPNDLLVVGWIAAFVYDTPEGAVATIQLLEYANTQLLEFRHYDELLTTRLKDVYQMLEEKRGPTRRWRQARQAEHLNAMRLDVIELTERSDNAIKFLSDMFYARAYRIASNKVGVADYRNLVEQKLRIAAELYESLVNSFHEARAFFLELMVVAILVIELVHLFRSGW
jgi:hypothetical protein